MPKARQTQLGRMTTRSSIMRALKRVRLVAMDVDGVLTDAGMYYSESVHGEGKIV